MTLEKVMKNKKISIWGGGYLGYTSIIKMQSAGFFINIFDFGSNNIEGLKDGTFPNYEQKEVWTKSGELPKVNMKKVNICSDQKQMFDASLHIVAFPCIQENDNNLLKRLAEIFIENSLSLNNPCLIFQSAGIPRSVEKHFIKKIEEKDIKLLISSAFRSDWTIEEFLINNQKQVVSGYTKEAREFIAEFYDYLGIETVMLSSIEEAEIYENTQKSLNYTLSAFLNELSLSYPGIDIRKLSKLLIKNLDEKEISAGLGSLKYKVANSIDHIFRGVIEKEYLSIMEISQRSNISILFYYCDLLSKKGISSVSVFGLSNKDVYKDIRFSPSVVLVEYLNKIGIEVYIHDSHYKSEEIKKLFPYASILDLKKDSIKTDALFIFREHSIYKSFSQNDLERLGITNLKVIIDDTGLFNKYRFSEATLYHIPGDGKLLELKNL